MKSLAKLDLIAGGVVTATLLLSWWIINGSKTRPAVVSAKADATGPIDAYNPELCKQVTHGKIYISLGRYVFPMAYSKGAGVVYDSLSAQNADLALKAPDPAEQKGCFGNPLQSTSHALFSPLFLAAGDKVSAVRSAFELITLYRLDRGNASRESDKIWMGETLQLEIGQSACKAATLREELPNGMSACRIKPTTPPNARQEDWAAIYTARPDIYATPMNRPFVVNCGPGLYSTLLYSHRPLQCHLRSYA